MSFVSSINDLSSLYYKNFTQTMISNLPVKLETYMADSLHKSDETFIGLSFSLFFIFQHSEACAWLNLKNG